MKSWITRGAVTLCLVAAGAVVTQPALAVTWYSAASPLKAYENGVAQAAAYGNFYNRNQSYAASQSYRRDLKPGGNGVFVHTDYYFWYAPCVNCPADYQRETSDRTNNTPSGSWVDSTYTTPLSLKSNSARGRIHVCEDHNWWADPCSVDALPTFSY